MDSYATRQRYYLTEGFYSTHPLSVINRVISVIGVMHLYISMSDMFAQHHQHRPIINTTYIVLIVLNTTCVCVCTMYDPNLMSQNA